MFISFFLSLFGVVEILVVIIHYLLELWIYSLKFERAQSVKFLCPRMSPLYYILDGKAQINSSSLIIYRSQFSLAFSSSCWTKYKLKHYLPLKLPSTVATSQKYHSSKYGKSLSLYHAVLSAYAFKGKFHHIGDNLHLILISDRSSKTAIIDLSCFFPRMRLCSFLCPISQYTPNISGIIFFCCCGFFSIHKRYILGQ